MMRRSWSTRWFVTSLVVLLAACGLGGHTPTAQRPPADAASTPRTGAPLVSVQPVGQTTLASTLSYAGNIQARASVNVLPQATGRVNRLAVDVGSSVRAGDLLAELDHAQLDAQVRQATAALGTAQSRLDLLLAGARPETIEVARASVGSAEQQLALMREGGRPENVATAQANLEAAQARLASVLSGSTQAQLDAARSAAESAYASVQSTSTALAQLLAGGAPTDQRQVEAALAQSQAQRDALRFPAPDQVQAARTAVDQAVANRQAAQARLDVLLAGGSMAEQVSAQTAVDSAAALVQSARQSLEALVNGGPPADRQAAQSAYAQAQTQIRAARVQYDALRRQANASDPANSSLQLTDLHAEVTRAQQAQQTQCGLATQSTSQAGPVISTGTASSTLSSTAALRPAATNPYCLAAQAALDRANAALQAAQQNPNRLGPQVSPSDFASARTAVEVAEASLRAAQARIDQLNNPPPDSLQAARTVVEQAEANLQAALANQQALRQPSPDTLAATRGAVETADAALRSAQTSLDVLLAGGPVESQRAAEAGVAQAQARLDALRNPPAADVASARTAASTAQANLASAASNLADVLAAPKAADLVAAISAADQAQQNLTLQRYPYRSREIQQQQDVVAQARANLALQAEPNRPQDIQQAQTAVEQARGAYEQARVQAAEAYVYAPYDGNVSARLVSEGALASPSTPLVTLVSRDVEILIPIEQALVGQLREGSPAILTTSSSPGEQFPAVVAVIAPGADSRTRTFQVKVVPENPEGKLKDGMYAQVTIRGTEAPDALAIPNQAIVQRGVRGIVFVVVDGKAQLREPQLGITDGYQSQVVSGLARGEQLIVVGQQSLNDGDPVRVSSAPTSG
jgi:RND family efflux transporter MFP subunit